MSDVELMIKGCNVLVGHTVDLLWREPLDTSFTRQITFNESGNAISGPCTAKRIDGGWQFPDRRRCASPALGNPLGTGRHGSTPERHCSEENGCRTRR